MIAKYLLIWLLLAVIAVVNGIVRESSYGKLLPQLVAHQVSTLTAIIATALVVWFAHRIWPIESSAQAWTIGLFWLIFTVVFEFGFGHYVAGHSWQRLLADYNLLQGRVWSLFLVWITVMPFVIYELGGAAT